VRPATAFNGHLVAPADVSPVPESGAWTMLPVRLLTLHAAAMRRRRQRR